MPVKDRQCLRTHRRRRKESAYGRLRLARVDVHGCVERTVPCLDGPPHPKDVAEPVEGVRLRDGDMWDARDPWAAVKLGRQRHKSVHERSESIRPIGCPPSDVTHPSIPEEHADIALGRRDRFDRRVPRDPQLLDQVQACCPWERRTHQFLRFIHIGWHRSVAHSSPSPRSCPSPAHPV